MNPFLSPRQQERLVLASRSPRRVEILLGLGFEFDIEPAPEHLEDAAGHPNPFTLPEVLADRKCAHVAARRPQDVVIAADTLVIVDGEVLSKPRDDEEARTFLARLSGRAHTVVTGLAIRCDARGLALSGNERTEVVFRTLGADEVALYVATGEGRDKAGSYAAQGVGAGLIRSIDGCFFNVVGLPVGLLLDMMKKV
jgi:septum formation protein